MAVNVNPPPMVKMPRKISGDKELEPYFRHLERFFLQMWKRSGGGQDSISELQNKTEQSFGAMSQYLLKRIGTGIEFTNDTSGFTVDSSLITTDKATA